MTHFCALFNHGKIKCWGNGEIGQLGYGSKKSRGDGPYEIGENWPYVGLGQDFLVDQVALGYYHSCALSRVGRVKCWGHNAFLQLGTSTVDGVYGDSIGDEPLEIGEEIPYLPVENDVLTDGKIKKIVSGDYFGCALFSSGRMKCWGSHFPGLFGVEGYESTKSYRDSSFVRFPRPIADVFTGFSENHSCILDFENKLYCFGINSYGALGLGTDVYLIGWTPESFSTMKPIKLGTEKRIVDVKVSYGFTCVLFEDGLVKCFGKNDYGQLGLGHKDNIGLSASDMGENLQSLGFLKSRFRKISVGSSHVCGISSSLSEVQCWGLNESGQLGIGNTTNIGDDANDLQKGLKTVNLGLQEVATGVVSAHSTTCAILQGKELESDFKVKCWGNGSDGRLAFPGVFEVGSTDDWLGDRLPYIDFGQ